MLRLHTAPAGPSQWRSVPLAQWVGVVAAAIAATVVLDLVLHGLSARADHPIAAAVHGAADAIRAPFDGLLPGSAVWVTTVLALMGYGLLLALVEAVRRAGAALVTGSTRQAQRLVAQSWLMASVALGLDAAVRLGGGEPRQGLGWLVAGPAAALRWPVSWLPDDAYVLATVLAIALWGAAASAAVAALDQRARPTTRHHDDAGAPPPAVEPTADPTLALVPPAPPTPTVRGGGRHDDRTATAA